MASPSRKARKTTDLTLATYLRIEGFEYQLVSDGRLPNGQPRGAWLFDSDGHNGHELLDAIDEFRSYDAIAEPTAFHRMLRSTQRELFEFLEIGSARRT